MRIKENRFIVVMLTDRDGFGFNEHTLPPLIRLMDAASPDFRNVVHTAVVGYFLASRDALERIRQIVNFAAELRTEDKRFERLGIGLAEGSMVVDLTFWGQLSCNQLPMGEVTGLADRNAMEAEGFRKALEILSHEFEAHA